MSLRIRMARGGSKNRPYYRIVVAESRSPRDGRFLERIGSYNPLLPQGHADRVKIDLEKAKEWMAKGATPSDRIARFLAAANVITLPATRPDQPKKSAPKAKAQERAKAEAEKAKAAADAAGGEAQA